MRSDLGGEGPHPQPARQAESSTGGNSGNQGKGAVYFETTMEGEKRRGHLWDHIHGKAQPRAERV